MPAGHAALEVVDSGRLSQVVVMGTPGLVPSEGVAGQMAVRGVGRLGLTKVGWLVSRRSA